MELCGGKRNVGGIVWWEEKGRRTLCGGKRKVGGIAVVGRER